MMINKRLIGLIPNSMRYVIAKVLMQWLMLPASMVMTYYIARILGAFSVEGDTDLRLVSTVIVILLMLFLRFALTIGSNRMGHMASRMVKQRLRNLIYEKLLRLGSSYKEKVDTSSVVQMSVEGVDQLETYFGSYLSQFFYAMLAPLTLFVVMSFISLRCAVVLLICVPLIPLAIAAVQTWAKKLLSKYWGQYTALGDTFLENLQGLTTLKVYQADEFKHKEMNRESENFRKITMRVLTMQLNSITIMDIIAFGGDALGVILAVLELKSGNINLTGCLLIILLASEFFTPMRQLGSFFHIAMNGMAASDKIFALLDLPEPPEKTLPCPDGDITLTDVTYSYHQDSPQVLHGVNMQFPKGSFTAVVGESGCGKSTVAGILTGQNAGYGGSVTIEDAELSNINEGSLLTQITYISHQSYLFKGTVRENLTMANETATDEELWESLRRVNLADFLTSEQGLDTILTEQGGNLSGGQRQRLALARALLHNSPVYIFDEATSNIDVESEDDIMREIHALAKTKTVVLISHRLANSVDADRIYVMEQGNISEAGTHEELLQSGGCYTKLWNAQQELEAYTKEGLQ